MELLIYLFAQFSAFERFSTNGILFDFLELKSGDSQYEF